MEHYSPTGRRNHGRPLKRILDMWDRSGPTSGLTPWQTDDDDDDDVSSKEGFPGLEQLLAAVCVLLVSAMVMYQEGIRCDACCYK